MNSSTGTFVLNIPTTDNFSVARRNLKTLAGLSETDPGHMTRLNTGIEAVRTSFLTLATSKASADAQLREDGLNKLKAFHKVFGNSRGHELITLIGKLESGGVTYDPPSPPASSDCCARIADCFASMFRREQSAPQERHLV